ncbi:MAG: tetratricopeptide repeat protein [Bacteroidales bacterium]|nr:tetratricopeptide repeat protein [Bacteroidales bacterium]
MRILFATLLFIALQFQAFSQESAIYQQPGLDQRLAEDLFWNKHFGVARQLFSEISEIPEPEIQSDAIFFEAISAAELTHADAPARIRNFIEEYPEHALAGEANLYLGKLYFRENKFKDAIRAFQGVEISSLSRASREELFFMIGYAQLRSGEPATAKSYFQRVTAQNAAYYSQARYYLAHIDYLQGNYKQALGVFEQIENDRRYQKIIPLYKIQIYHYLGEFDKVMSMGPGLFESSSTINKPEIARITGNAFFQAKDYVQAANYLGLYERTNRRSLSREDQYLIGFVKYKAGEYKDAIGNFQQAIRQNDELSQNAYYYLGICYNETGQKIYAGNAFLAAYKAGFDKQISEEALFNYIKITLESPFNPYNEAITLLENYLRANPGSVRSDEGYDYLSQLYLSSRNYRQALESIEAIERKNPRLQAAYQKILFYRAAELFNLNDLQGSLDLYKKAAELNHDDMIRNDALYWSGEISYRQNNLAAAIKYYKDFLNSSQARRSAEYANAFYSLGYVHFNRKEHGEAITQFNKYLEVSQGKDRKLASDSYLRLGDAYFASKQYDRAISNYDKVIASKESAMDYALYYKSLSEGAKGNYSRKIEVLKILVNNYPKSGYVDEAYYETALAYILLNQESQALVYFDKLIQAFPTNTKSIQAWLRKGFIYFNRSDYTQAINSFKTVVDRFPGTKESQEALAALKNIYMEMGQIDQYFAYVRNIPFAAVDITEEDSLNFAVAENFYMQNRCDQAIGAFQRYLDKFHDGAYSPNALFYQAECYMKTNQKQKAVEGFKKVAQKPISRFTEAALATASGMEFSARNYQEALPLFEQLEMVAEDPAHQQAALAGQMRCHYQLKDISAAAGAANRLLSTGRATQDQTTEAHFIIGLHYLSQNDLTAAESELLIPARLKGTEMGAEASYHLAWIAFTKGRKAESEEKIYALAEDFAASDYWVAKGFILLADIYAQDGNTFQARETLQSVIDNYVGPELGEVAREKLRRLGN